ncbi:hypothetical protein [uncultured Bacteroides sp.]|jgi:hypothetical protein|uniref:hypothetical protein n=1 Tax=uncultured Bacteroides sp. TaxID=162156 RepID=UPI00280A516C|nr:hypothetical protein [uncultured Bacteroides sp.]
MKNLYRHSIDLKKISIDNTDRNAFSQQLINLPYRGYEVEELPDNRKIVITKPGGKTVYGKPKKEDFLVFIYNPSDDSLWQISHSQILDDVTNKVRENKEEAKKFLSLMERTCNGEEPADFIDDIRALHFDSGESPEALIKAYKWIWGQEDINYPNGEGRMMSWRAYQEIIAEL